jgi:hypothetical protein
MTGDVLEREPHHRAGALTACAALLAALAVALLPMSLTIGRERCDSPLAVALRRQVGWTSYGTEVAPVGGLACIPSAARMLAAAFGVATAGAAVALVPALRHHP